MWNTIRDEVLDGLRKATHTGRLVITGIALQLFRNQSRRRTRLHLLRRHRQSRTLPISIGPNLRSTTSWQQTMGPMVRQSNRVNQNLHQQRSHRVSPTLPDSNLQLQTDRNSNRVLQGQKRVRDPLQEAKARVAHASRRPLSLQHSQRAPPGRGRSRWNPRPHLWLQEDLRLHSHRMIPLQSSILGTSYNIAFTLTF